MKKIKVEFVDGTTTDIEKDNWGPKTFSMLQSKHNGIIIKIDGEHPSTWGMQYEEIIFELDRIGFSKAAIDKVITEVKLIRETHFLN